MTFYQQQVRQIQAAVYPHDYQRKQVLRARQFMERQYAEPIGLPDLASAAGCSKFHFLRLFRHYYGRTPHQYLTEMRIGRAKELLRTGIPAAAACFAVGFDSVSSFTALFKRITGSTPHAFAARSRQKSNFREDRR